MKKLLTIAEASQILNCSKRSTYRLLSDGLLEGCKIRNSTRIVPASLDRYIEQQVLAYQLENGEYRLADGK